MNLHTVRSGGFAGIAFVVVVLISAFAPGIPPDNTRPPAEIAAYYDAHRTMLLFAAWLTCIAAVLFAWYLTAIYRVTLAAGGDEGLPMFTLVNGIIANAIALVAAAMGAALVFHPSSAIGTQAGLAVADVYAMAGAIIWLPLAAFTFGASLSGGRHNSLPSWLNLIGYVSTVISVIASLSIMSNSGIMALGGISGLIALLVWLVWTLLSAVVLVGKAARTA